MDDIRHLTLLTASLRNCGQRSEMHVTNVRASRQRKALYRKLALKILLFLSRDPDHARTGCAPALQLLLATHADVREEDLLQRLLLALAAILKLCHRAAA